jgi:hypothetical protein
MIFEGWIDVVLWKKKKIVSFSTKINANSRGEGNTYSLIPITFFIWGMGKKKGTKRARDANAADDVSGQTKKKIKKSVEPKTYLDKTMAAIRETRVPCGKASSRQAIAKYIKTRWGVNNTGALRKALKKGVDTGKLLHDKQSFKVAGENPRGGSVEDLNKEFCHHCHNRNPLYSLVAVRELLEVGAQIGATAKLPCSPVNECPALGIAARYGHTEMVQMLLKYGANIDEQDGWGQTPLFLAAHGGHPETLKVRINYPKLPDNCPPSWKKGKKYFQIFPNLFL